MADLNDNDKYAMQLAFPGRTVVFRGEYAIVTVVQGTDKALTADIARQAAAELERQRLAMTGADAGHLGAPTPWRRRSWTRYRSGAR